MSYTTTLMFNTEYVTQTDTVQLVMVFTHNLSGSNTVLYPADHGIKVLDYGSAKIQYEVEDAFLVPSEYQFALIDTNSILEQFFFGNDSVGAATEKKAKVILYRNGSILFVGSLIEEKISYSMSTRIASLKAMSKIDELNKYMIYDTDNNPINPFGYSTNSYVRVTALLEDIFRVVNPSIVFPASLSILHDWDFQGVRNTEACYLNDIKFEELLERVDPLYFDPSTGIRTLGDVLRKLAIDWCSFTGFVNEEKAFFKRLFYWSATNLQSVKVYDHIKNYKLSLLDYVEYTTGIGDPNEPYKEGVFTGVEGRYLKRSSLPGFYWNAGTGGTNILAFINRTDYYVFDTGEVFVSPPLEGAVYSVNGSEFEVKGTPFPSATTRRVVTKRFYGSTEPPASGTLTLVSGVGPPTIDYTSVGDANANGSVYYYVYQARTNYLFNKEFKNSGALAAKFWYTYRGFIDKCRIDRFVLNGINYDYLKDFSYLGEKFQIVNMEYDLSKGITTCDALFIGV